jgi:hypothetical protein
LHKVVHKAREQNLQGRLIKRNGATIYIHINRLFFLLLGGFKYDSFWTFSNHIWDDVLQWPTFVLMGLNYQLGFTFLPSHSFGLQLSSLSLTQPHFW